MMEKYKCDLCMSAEDYTTGSMMLTKDEYEIVKRVSNIANWNDLVVNPWSGSFSISCEELDGEDWSE